MKDTLIFTFYLPSFYLFWGNKEDKEEPIEIKEVFERTLDFDGSYISHMSIGIFVNEKLFKNVPNSKSTIYKSFQKFTEVNYGQNAFCKTTLYETSNTFSKSFARISQYPAKQWYIFIDFLQGHTKNRESCHFFEVKELFTIFLQGYCKNYRACIRYCQISYICKNCYKIRFVSKNLSRKNNFCKNLTQVS